MFADTAAIHRRLVQALRRKGLQRETKVQKLSFPLLHSMLNRASKFDKDLPGFKRREGAYLFSPPGSGKTLAFLLPSLSHMMTRLSIRRPISGIHSLILVPTVSLQKQVLRAAHDMVPAGMQKHIRGLEDTQWFDDPLPSSTSMLITTPKALVHRYSLDVSQPLLTPECDLSQITSKQFIEDMKGLQYCVIDECDSVLQPNSRYRRAIQAERGLSPNEKLVNALLSVADPVLVLSSASTNQPFRKQVRQHGWIISPSMVDTYEASPPTLQRDLEHRIHVLENDRDDREWLPAVLRSLKRPTRLDRGRRLILVTPRPGFTVEDAARQIELEGTSIMPIERAIDQGFQGTLGIIAAADQVRGLVIPRIEEVILLFPKGNAKTYAHCAGRALRHNNTKGRITSIVEPKRLRDVQSMSKFLQIQFIPCK